MPILDGVELKLQLLAHLALPRCPHCSTAHPTIVHRQQFNVVPKRPDSLAIIGAKALQWVVYACESCGGLIAGAAALDQNDRQRTPHAQWVIPTPRSNSDDLPPRVQSFLKQAEETITSPSASIVMCAS